MLANAAHSNGLPPGSSISYMNSHVSHCTLTSARIVRSFSRYSSFSASPVDHGSALGDSAAQPVSVIATGLSPMRASSGAR